MSGDCNRPGRKGQKVWRAGAAGDWPFADPVGRLYAPVDPDRSEDPAVPHRTRCALFLFIVPALAPAGEKVAATAMDWYGGGFMFGRYFRALDRKGNHGVGNSNPSHLLARSTAASESSRLKIQRLHSGT